MVPTTFARGCGEVIFLGGTALCSHWGVAQRGQGVRDQMSERTCTTATPNLRVMTGFGLDDSEARAVAGDHRKITTAYRGHIDASHVDLFVPGVGNVPGWITSAKTIRTTAGPTAP